MPDISADKTAEKEKQNLKVTFIYHSSFQIETDRAVLLLDYFEGKLPEAAAGKPRYIFASHAHADHFSEAVFDLTEVRRFFLSDDIPESAVPAECRERVTWLRPGETVTESEITVQSLRSNDLGIAAVISFEEDGVKKQIYHAGDLNNWWWDGDAEDEAMERHYRAELAKIRGTVFDAAFVPLDPRLTGWWKGMEDFMAVCDAKAVFPMHMNGNYSILSAMKARPEAAGFAEKIQSADKSGKTWEV